MDREAVKAWGFIRMKGPYGFLDLFLCNGGFELKDFLWTD